MLVTLWNYILWIRTWFYYSLISFTLILKSTESWILISCSLSTSDSVYLLCCYNYLNIYPSTSLKLLFKKLAEEVDQLDDTQVFYSLTAIAKCKYQYTVEIRNREKNADIDHVVESLLDRYLTRKDISSSIVGIDCMLLRILAGVGLWWWNQE